MPFIVPAVVVLVCIGILTWFVRDMKRARARIAGRSETLETTFGTIEYATAGEGPAILVAHGAGGGFDQGLDMTIGATGHGFQLIVPSRFGYLRSSLPQQASPAMQADAYAELLDHLGFEQVAVLGISAGAWSAVEFAARHPLRCHALLLLVPAQALPPGVTNEGGPIVRALFESDLLLWTASKLMRLAPALVAPAAAGDADLRGAIGLGRGAESPAASRRSPAAHFSPLARHLARSQDGPGPTARAIRKHHVPGAGHRRHRRRVRYGRSGASDCRRRGARTSRDLPQWRTPPRRTTSRPDRTNHVVSSRWLTQARMANLARLVIEQFFDFRSKRSPPVCPSASDFRPDAAW